MKKLAQTVALSMAAAFATAAPAFSEVQSFPVAGMNAKAVSLKNGQIQLTSSSLPFQKAETAALVIVDSEPKAPLTSMIQFNVKLDRYKTRRHVLPAMRVCYEDAAGKAEQVDLPWDSIMKTNLGEDEYRVSVPVEAYAKGKGWALAFGGCELPKFGNNAFMDLYVSEIKAFQNLGTDKSGKSQSRELPIKMNLDQISIYDYMNKFNSSLKDVVVELKGEIAP